MQIRLIIGKPTQHWLGEREVEDGYWGFVRCKKNYEEEKKTISDQFEKVFKDLRKEGMEIEILPEVEIREIEIDKYEVLKESDVNIYLPFQMSGWDLVVSSSKYLISFDKFKPNIYSGTLFFFFCYQKLKRLYPSLGRRIFLVEEDWEKLKSILRSIYSLTKISLSNLVCVGPINSTFGGWSTLRKGIGMFGYKVKFYTYDKFVKDFNKFYQSEEKQEEAKKVVKNFTSKATKLVEPNEEKLLRAAIYSLVLKKYIEENNSDWITVNCLSELISKTKATPCMAFSIFNDSGIVATCEADPAEMCLHYLMRYISEKPAFFQDPTVNEKDGTLILAHCTSPTKFLGFERPNFSYQIRTHHESNYGATPKPTFEQGEVTIAGFSFDLSNMLIIKGRVIGTPDLRICRSQVEVKVNNAPEILENWQGFHWVLVYGDYVKELEIICKIKGINPLIYK